MSEINFSGNLREAMAKYNVSSLFDGMFTTTASHLMSKTRVGGKVSQQPQTHTPLHPWPARTACVCVSACQPVPVVCASLNAVVRQPSQLEQSWCASLH